MAEVSPLRQRDQDVADSTAEVEDPVLRRDVGRTQDAPVRGVDHPQPTPGKDVSHADPSQTTAEPFAVMVADGGLVDAAGLIAHWPTLPAARALGRPPPWRPIFRSAATAAGLEN